MGAAGLAAGATTPAAQLLEVTSQERQARAEGVGTLRMGTDLPTDGAPVQFASNPEADSAAMRMPATGVMVLDLGRAGSPASTRVYSVSADGKEMTEVASYMDTAGKPFLRVNHFIRMP